MNEIKNNLDLIFSKYKNSTFAKESRSPTTTEIESKMISSRSRKIITSSLEYKENKNNIKQNNIIIYYGHNQQLKSTVLFYTSARSSSSSGFTGYVYPIVQLKSEVLGEKNESTGMWEISI